MELKFRTLRADEIDCRVGMCNEKGCSLLLYKDARCDMNILDETVGPFNWQREHSRDNANCTVSIYDPDKRFWVRKEDTGTESQTEAEKGLASDSFKRACFNWGIGRELYTAPFIWIKAADCNPVQKGQRWTVTEKFKVGLIEYTDGKITGLEISGKKGVVFSYRPLGVVKSDAALITPNMVKTLKQVCDSHKIPVSVLCGQYKHKALEEFTTDDWADFKKNGPAFLAKWDEEHENTGKD